MNKVVAVLLFSLALGCSVGPNYKRPGTNLPQNFRGGQPSSEPASLADEKWSEVFQDKELHGLIDAALKQNYDIRIAATRIEQARAQLGITRADQFPTVTAGANAISQQSRFSESQSFKLNAGQLNVSAAWELDFWGKYRRATEAARAQLLATEWGRREVIRTLVSDIAAAYFALRELDLELEISQRTLVSRRDSLKLIQLLADRGLRSDLDVHQAEQLLYTASTVVPDLQRRIGQQENFIRVLLGQNPGDVPRGAKLPDQPLLAVVPAGVPSSLLERRPDIHQAEQELIALNARIGVAKAAYFPQISLTGNGGYQSTALKTLFTGGGGAVWNFAASLVQPIFEAGRLKSRVRIAQAQRDEAVLVYQQTIQQALREVSDSLIAYEKNQEARSQQQLLTDSARQATQLSQMRYDAGTASYLEVLDSNSRLFTAELGLAQSQLNERLALVQLYRSLGGGWQQ